MKQLFRFQTPKEKIKKPKTKNTVKLKKKPRRSPSDDSDNNYSDNNSPLDYEVDEKVNIPETTDDIKFEIEVSDVELMKKPEVLNNLKENTKHQPKTLRRRSKSAKSQSGVKVQAETSEEQMQWPMAEKSEVVEKDFKCAQCDSRFGVRSELESHVLQHAGVSCTFFLWWN